MKRLRYLQVGSPHELHLLGEIYAHTTENAHELERLTHVALEQYHVRGEWFQMVPKTLALVELMKTRRYSEFRSLVCGWSLSTVSMAKFEVRHT